MARIIDAFTQFFDDNGNPLIDGFLAFKESGTNNTDKDTFADINELTSNKNPVPLDGAGRCPNVFGSGAYNVISYAEDANNPGNPGQQIQQFDPVSAEEFPGAFSEWNSAVIYGENDIVTASDDKYYRSITNNNQNNEPSISSDEWEEVRLLRVVNSIAELRLGSTLFAGNITVNGYYGDGDGGGGEFYWDSTSTETDNGGTIIKATAVVTGRWKKLCSDKVSVKEFGAYSDGTNAAITALAIIAATELGIKTTFPEGTYNYNSQILIDSLDSASWEARGAVTLYDEGKSINLDPTGTGIVPVGVRFTNCGSVSLKGFKSDSAVPSTSGTIIAASENDRWPNIDFDTCGKVFLDDHELAGYVGPLVDNLSLGPAHMMRASYFRFNLCTDVTINTITIPTADGGRGEMVSFAYCDKLRWDGCYYEQGVATDTFASLGKVIMTDDAELSNFKIQSETSSSMFDLLGLNITLRNMGIDAPNSNIDVSAEWSIADAVIDNLTLDNVNFNGSHAVTTYSGSNKPTIKMVKVLNDTYEYDTYDKFILSNRFTELMIVDNFKCNNGRNVVWAGAIDADLVLNKDMVMNSPIITSDQAVTGGSIAIDVTGRMKINNPTIDLQGFNKLLLKDAKAVDDAVSLTTSDSNLIIEGGSIKNCVILIYANTTFKSVEMFNVTFESLSVANGGLVDDPTIRFEGCSQELTDVSPVAINAKFFADIQTGSCKFIEHRLTGVADTGGNTTFGNFTTDTVDLDWQGGYINCARTAAGLQYLFNHDNDEAVEIPRSSIIHGGAVIGPLNRTLTTTGATTTPTEYTNLRFINVQWEEETADTPFVLAAADADRLRLVFTGTNMNGTGWSYLLARTTKVLAFINDGNTESDF